MTQKLTLGNVASRSIRKRMKEIKRLEEEIERKIDELREDCDHSLCTQCKSRWGLHNECLVCGFKEFTRNTGSRRRPIHIFTNMYWNGEVIRFKRYSSLNYLGLFPLRTPLAEILRTINRIKKKREKREKA